MVGLTCMRSSLAPGIGLTDAVLHCVALLNTVCAAIPWIDARPARVVAWIVGSDAGDCVRWRLIVAAVVLGFGGRTDGDAADNRDHECATHRSFSHLCTYRDN